MSYPRVSPLGGTPSVLARAVNYLLSIVEPVEATAADIADATASINTSGKFTGKLVWDATNARMVRASGRAATDAWVVIDGSASVTPA